ncbi:MAG: LptA/OstA family protein, partial [Candidatus Methylomirabilales bacterium]
LYTGNVVATTTDLTVTADRMEFEFDEKMEAVERMVAIGNVQISRSDGTRAMSERATYDVLQDRLMLEGKEKGRVTAVIHPKQQQEQMR